MIYFLGYFYKVFNLLEPCLIRTTITVSFYQYIYVSQYFIYIYLCFQVLLDNYLKKCVAVLDIARSEELMGFLTTDRVSAEEDLAASMSHALGNPYQIPITEEMPDDVEVCVACLRQSLSNTYNRRNA